MTKTRTLFIALLATVIFLFAGLQRTSAQQMIARTISPAMVIRVLGFQDVKPEDLHNLQRLYESTGWKILKMDDDPSDGKMAVRGARNMELSMDEFAVTGTDKPNNGIFIHLSKTNGFKVDFIKIVFNDEKEENLFKRILPRFGINNTSDDEFSGNVQLKNGQTVEVECTFDIEGMNPKVDIEVNRSEE